MTDIKRVRARTQVGRVLAMLRDHRPVCSTRIYNDSIRRPAARVCDLRALGLHIESRTCRNGRHDHGGDPTVEYVLHPAVPIVGLAGEFVLMVPEPVPA
ncbi:hypothetical protein HQ535_15610 [bacterium]|nr:hypothetical protein [bacterium]